MTEPTHQTVRLSRGRHSSPDEGACVMELASMLAHEPFSDHPKAVCPVIGEFLRTYNDAVDDERRQDLYAAAAAVVGTRGTRADERRRANLCLQAARRPRHWWATSRLWRSQAGWRAAARLARKPSHHLEALALLDRLTAVGRAESAAAQAAELASVAD
jgi:hypothetical protein